MTNPEWIGSRRVLGPFGPDGRLEVAPRYLRISGGRIAEIRETPPDVPFDDLGERLITPAFINAHTHLALGVLRGFDLGSSAGNMVEDFFFAVESLFTKEDVRAFARMGAYESLLFGVGLVYDHYYHATSITAALKDTGLAGVVAPTLQDLDGPGVSHAERSLEDTRAIAEDSDLQRRGIFAALGPHATDTVSEALFGRAVELASSLNVPLHAHLAQSIEEYQRARERHGCSPTEWLERIGALSVPSLFAHGIYCSFSDLELLNKRDQALVHCPYSALVFGFPARLDAWHVAGSRFAVATDCAASNDSMGVQKELRYVAGQRVARASFEKAYVRFLLESDAQDAEKAWEDRQDARARMSRFDDPRELLSLVWDTPGRFHPGFRAGVVAEGALANLIAWDLDHPALWPGDPIAALTFAEPSHAIHAMWVCGAEIGSRGDYARSIVNSPEYREAREEADARFRAIKDRLA